jgi:hypothetical protein
MIFLCCVFAIGQAWAARSHGRANTAQNTAAKQKKKYPNDGMNWRERMAVKYMKKRLSREYPVKQYNIKCKPTLVQYPGNKQRPVTGQRPVSVDGKVTYKKGQGNMWGHVKLSMDSTARARWYVDVRKGALPAVVDKQSMTPLAKVRRALPLGEKLHDIVHSRGVRDGVITAGLGAAAAPVSGTASAGAVGWGVLQMYQGVERRGEARRIAVDRTASWAKESIAKGITPSAAEAYGTYRQYLQAQKPGTAPGSMGKFLDGLAVHGL